MLLVGKDSNCHGHTNARLPQSTDDEATTDKVTNMELDMMRLETREVGSGKTQSFWKCPGFPQ